MPRKFKSTTRLVYIPQILKSIVENYSKNDKRKTIRLFKGIQNIHKQQNVPQNHYVDIPRSYLRKIVRDYPKYIQILIDNDLIERTGDYSFVNKSQCYSYRILPDILDEFKIDSITELPSEKEKFLDESKRQQIKKTLDKLSVNKDAAYQWIDSYVSKLNIDDFTTNYDINFEYINLKLPGETQKVSRDRAILDAFEEGKVVVQTKKEDCIVVFPDEFVEQKKLELEQEYKMQVDMLKRGIYSISRSPLNYRVYHNLCNLKKELLEFVKLDGQQLVNVDIANSQIAILVNVIEGNLNYESGWQFPDVELTDNDQTFLTLAKEGNLYEYIRDMLGLNTRKEAKKTTFSMLFAHYGRLSIELYQFKQKFPGVFQYIDQFKRLNNRLNGENHRSTLPIFLQRVESCLIIDELWDQIPQGVPFLSIHDSFLTTEKNSQMFQNLIHNKLDCKVAA